MKPKKEISWETNNFHYYQKTVAWYGGLLIVTAALAFFFLWIKFYWLSIIIAVAGVVTAKLSNVTPSKIRFSFDNRGLTIKDKFYPFAFFKSYYLDDSYGVKRLYLSTTRKWMPTMVVFLGDQDLLVLAKFLDAHLPAQINGFEVLNHKVMHWLKL